MFLIDNDGDFRSLGIRESDQLLARLPAGAYRVLESPSGLYFRPHQPTQEHMVQIGSRPMRLVTREVRDFFNPELQARLRDAGLKNRRGVILHGPPGTGKTSLVRLLFPEMIAHDAVILLDCNADHLEHRYIPAIRHNDPDRPIVIVFDEFEKTVKASRLELLRLLDGIVSPDRILTIGATNFIEEIPEQLRNRPSRFSLVLEVRELALAYRSELAARKYPMLNPDDREFAVQLTAAQPLDFLEEACKLVLMGYEPDEVRDRLSDMSVGPLPEEEPINRRRRPHERDDDDFFTAW
jgi:hypothetical protein